MTDPPGLDSVCLAIDLGTGGPKVGFVRLGGEILWHDHRVVETRWLDGGARTKVTYRIHVKPKLPLPDSMIQTTQATRLPQVIQYLRDRTAQR